MAAYSSAGYLLKNPFVGTRLLKRAEQGFQGAKQQLAQHQKLYQGALEAGAGTRESYIEKVRPQFEAEQFKAEVEVDPHTYAAAARTVESDKLRDSYNRLAKKAKESGISGHVKKMRKSKRNIAWKELGAQEELIGRHEDAAQKAVDRLAEKASGYNLFFGGTTPAYTPNLTSSRTMDDYIEQIRARPSDEVDSMRSIYATPRGRVDRSRYPYSLRGATGDEYQRGLDYAKERVFNTNPLYTNQLNTNPLYTNQLSAWELKYGYGAPY
jgi:hypothetical protein